MTARVFVDTNVLVYCRDVSEKSKQEQALDWMSRLWHNRSGRLSFQVLQEFNVTVTVKLRPGLDRELARSDVRALLAWQPLPLEARVMEGAWRLQDHYGLSWWDALIVAAAQVADCSSLLSEDFQAGQEVGSVAVINPFKTSPQDLGQ